MKSTIAPIVFVAVTPRNLVSTTLNSRTRQRSSWMRNPWIRFKPFTSAGFRKRGIPKRQIIPIICMWQSAPKRGLPRTGHLRNGFCESATAGCCQFHPVKTNCQLNIASSPPSTPRAASFGGQRVFLVRRRECRRPLRFCWYRPASSRRMPEQAERFIRDDGEVRKLPITLAENIRRVRFTRINY
jgi:hypothetical protein